MKIAGNEAGWNELISSAEIVPAPIEGGHQDSSGILRQEDHELWADAVDTLLKWRQSDEDVDPSCVDSALDFALDQRDSGASPPLSMIATEDGEITFEWRLGELVFMVSIMGPGVAEYTLMRDCRVEDEGMLYRDPRTRKLQLELR